MKSQGSSCALPDAVSPVTKGTVRGPAAACGPAGGEATVASCGVVSEGLADTEPRVLLGVLDRDALDGLKGLVSWE